MKEIWNTCNSGLAFDWFSEWVLWYYKARYYYYTFFKARPFWGNVSISTNFFFAMWYNMLKKKKVTHQSKRMRAPTLKLSFCDLPRVNKQQSKLYIWMFKLVLHFMSRTKNVSMYSTYQKIIYFTTLNSKKQNYFCKCGRRYLFSFILFCQHSFTYLTAWNAVYRKHTVSSETQI